ncbi:MAG: hypothetical protein IJZ88_02830 [Clostridia bacterium]|nr:hypothetical protein [Clostridia bacterium]
MTYIKKIKYPICFLVLIFLCLLFPYSGDDWAWGSDIGIERLENWFDNYNGRYVGNLIVLALTRSNVLKSVVMAFVLTGIVYLIEKIIDKNWAFTFAAITLLLMPSQVFSQAVVWTSGFSNYSVSIFFTLIFIYYFLKKNPNDIKGIMNVLHMAIFLVLGVICTLIVEHLTIYSILLGAFALIFGFVKYRKMFLPYMGYFVGCIIGTIYMFSNTAYVSISNESDGYRTMAGSFMSLIKTAVINYGTEIYDGFFMSNVVLNIAFAFIGVLIYSDMKICLKNKTLVLCKTCLVIIVLYAVLSIIHFLISVLNINIMLIKVLEGGFTIVAGVALIAFLLIVSFTHKKVFIFSFYVLSILCLLAPLFVVTPVGGRCFMATYVLFIILLGEMIKLLSVKKKEALCQRKVVPGCKAVTAGCLAFFFMFFGTIYKADRERLENVKCKVEKGEKTIMIDELPFSSYIWCGNPIEGTIWAERYKMFYGLPDDIFLNIEK